MIASEHGETEKKKTFATSEETDQSPYLRGLTKAWALCG